MFFSLPVPPPIVRCHEPEVDRLAHVCAGFLRRSLQDRVALQTQNVEGLHFQAGGICPCTSESSRSLWLLCFDSFLPCLSPPAWLLLQRSPQNPTQVRQPSVSASRDNLTASVSHTPDPGQDMLEVRAGFHLSGACHASP